MDSKRNPFCISFDREIWLYLSGELDERQELWQVHLESCPVCREKWQQIEGTLGRFDDLPTTVLSNIEYEKSMARLFLLAKSARRRRSIASMAFVLLLFLIPLLFFRADRDVQRIDDFEAAFNDLDSTIEQIDLAMPYLFDFEKHDLEQQLTDLQMEIDALELEMNIL